MRRVEGSCDKKTLSKILHRLLLWADWFSDQREPSPNFDGTNVVRSAPVPDFCISSNSRHLGSGEDLMLSGHRGEAEPPNGCRCASSLISRWSGPRLTLPALRITAYHRAMLSLTRRRDPDSRDEAWLIFYGDLRVGAVGQATRKAAQGIVTEFPSRAAAQGQPLLRMA
jgi:hypothetical protein